MLEREKNPKFSNKPKRAASCVWGNNKREARRAQISPFHFGRKINDLGGGGGGGHVRLLTTSLGLLSVVGRDTSLNEPSSTIYAPFKRCLLIRYVNVPDIPSGEFLTRNPRTALLLIKLMSHSPSH